MVSRGLLSGRGHFREVEWGSTDKIVRATGGVGYTVPGRGSEIPGYSQQSSTY